MLFNTQAAVGCSLQALTLRKIATPLTVVVTHIKKPMAGIEVQVVPEESANVIFSGTTDEHGAVLIDGLMAGKYYLTASHDDFDAGKEWIEVVATPGPKVRKRLEFQWADWSYRTRRVAGTLTGVVPGNTGNKLMDIIHPVETAYQSVAIELKNAFSDDVRHAVSDSTGAFFIDDVPDGIYVLTIAGGMKAVAGTADITRQVVDVSAGATRESLPLRLQDTGCYRIEFALTDER